MRKIRRILVRIWEIWQWLRSDGQLNMSKEEAAVEIEKFLEGKGGDWDWDDFITISQKDPYLDRVRIKCSSVFYDYPAGKEGGYCSEEGYEVLRNLVKELRQGDPP